jgi:hypothetical protein
MTVGSNPAYQGAVRGTVSYGVAGAPSTITIAQLQFVRPERTFPADCGIARLRLDSPELHFAQLDPFDEKRIARTLIARFDRSRFVELAKAQEAFRDDLEGKLTGPLSHPSERRAPRKAGHLTKLFEEARFAGESVTAIIDADFEMVSYALGRAGMVFLATSQNQLASALVAHSPEVVFDPVLEVTMTTALLADLLLSWKNLAESLT